MIQKNEPLSSKDFSKGLVTRSDIIKNDPNQSPNCMDIKWFFDGSIGKRMGSSTTNTISVGSTSVAGWTLDSSGSLSSNLQSYWKLDESVGTRLDAVGVVNLADVNTTQSIVGIRNQAAILSSVDSNHLVGTNASGIQTGNINFSLSTWVYLNSTSSTLEQTLISKRDPDIDSATKLLLHVDGTPFTDSSPAPHTITTSGTVLLSATSGKFSNCAQFNGVDSKIISPDSADWQFGSGPYTIDFWVRFSTLPAQPVMIDVGSASDLSNGVMITYNASTLYCYVGGVAKQFAWLPVVGTLYHVALVRDASNNLYAFVNGVQIGSTLTDLTNHTSNTAGVTLGFASLYPSLNFHSGWIDEVRITKGVARWTSAFTPPTRAYGVNDYEYWLYLNTNQQATFRVSSSGSNSTATVQASSFGALGTSTWYNIVAWHSNNNHIGISVNNAGTNITVYTTGVRVGSAPIVLGALSSAIQGNATTFLNARQDETGFWKKVLNANDRSNLYGGGSGNTYSGGASGFGWGMFDFGASNMRWLTVAAGTGIVASSNLGTTFVTIATSRTQNYQSFERSKNVLIATSDAYDPTLYWAGSATTFANTLAPNSAPAAKYSVNYQGFLILLNYMNSNGAISPRGFAYADENLQLTDSWTNHFDFPSSADDEITASFVLNKFLYVSTRYKIFRVAFVGGNPDWSFLKVKDYGYVPRTVKIMTLKGSTVAVGMDWNRRIRVFDGFDDLFISDNVENDNNYCNFAMDKVSYAGSGLIYAHAEFDQLEQEYRLNLAIGANSTNTTHAVVINGRTLAIYPYQNQLYQAMCIAESNNQQHLMAVDRSGFVHVLNSGNLDVSQPINDQYDSPILFPESPLQVSKAQQMNFFFNVSSSGTMYYQDRFDMSSVFSQQKILKDRNGNAQLTGAESSLQILRTVDIPATYNTYQFRLASSSGTAEPWRLTKWDFVQNAKGIGMGK